MASVQRVTRRWRRVPRYAAGVGAAAGAMLGWYRVVAVGSTAPLVASCKRELEGGAGVADHNHCAAKVLPQQRQRLQREYAVLAAGGVCRVLNASHNNDCKVGFSDVRVLG